VLDLLKVLLPIVAFLIQRWMDPRLVLKREAKREEEERQQFRAAVASRDHERVSILLSRRLQRLRGAGKRGGREG